MIQSWLEGELIGDRGDTERNKRKKKVADRFKEKREGRVQIPGVRVRWESWERE